MKHSIKAPLSKIFTGFLYGIGLCISVAIFFYVLDKSFSAFQPEREYGWDEFDESSKLEILDHSVISSSSEDIAIIGSIRNGSDTHWSGVKFEIELYYDNDEFLFECTDSIENIIKPGQVENFKITCGSCAISIPNFSSYKIKVIDASGKKY